MNQSFKKFLSFAWELFKIVVIAFAIVVPIRIFLFEPFFVKGQSMEPNFENGDYLIVDRLSYRLRPPERGEVIVFKYPLDTSQRYIKRVIGLPGEMVQIMDGKIKILETNFQVLVLDESSYLPDYTQTGGDISVTLSSSEYFVLGDNRAASYDSRRWGPVPKSDIIGRVLIRAWPFATAAKIKVPAYSE